VKKWFAWRVAAPLGAALVTACGGATDTSSLVAPPQTSAQLGAFNARTVRVSGTEYAYQVFVPAAYTASRSWPVIVALHGSGEKGSDNQKQLGVGLGPVVRAAAATFPAIVVFPQMPALEGGPPFDPVLLAELDATMHEFAGDPARVYATGLSLGGIVEYSVVSANPSRFAAFVPIAADICVVCVTGSASSPKDAVYTSVLTPMRNVPTWIFHGSADPNVPVDDARLIYQILTQLHAPVKYTEYAGAGHEIWDQVYGSLDFLTWLLAQHK